MSTKRGLALGIPLMLGFFVVLLIVSAPGWVKVFAAVVGVGFYWRYRWTTGVREQTLDALRMAKRKDEQRRKDRENDRSRNP